MSVDGVLGWFGLDKVTSGIVTGKTHYAPTSIATPESGAGGSFVPANQAMTESWSLHVRGLGRFGSETVEEIYVDEMTWNSIEVGDRYGAAH